MDSNQQAVIDRRRFLKWVTTLPVLGALAALASPLLRFLKPNVERFKIYAPTINDTPRGEIAVVAKLSEVSKPWDSKYFVFTQKYAQYEFRGLQREGDRIVTPQGEKAASVAGVVIRLPFKMKLYDPSTRRGPLSWAREIGKEPKVTESDIIVFSRICPHLGCIFNYVANYREVTAGYGGYTPPPNRQHALMACPCHLSIYDPADQERPGRVLSGPAPRPPRTFLFEIQGENIVVTDVEPGGIA